MRVSGRANPPKLQCIEDKCTDHHWDIHILPWNASSDHQTLSFGVEQNDIPIHSELLQKAEISDNKEQAIRKETEPFITKFISHIVSSQCPRYDLSVFFALEQEDTYNDYVEYSSQMETFIKQLLDYMCESTPATVISCSFCT